MSTNQGILRFTGHKSLATRLILATLHGRAIHVSQIRPNNPTNPGLQPHEISLLRLLESVTNGSQIEISYTGTTLLYRPGLITGSVPGRGADAGGVITHNVDGRVGRGLSYLVIPLLLLAPFSKGKVNVRFTGPGVITSAVERYGDISIDSCRTAVLPVFEQFGLDLERDIEIRTIKRSNPSDVKGHGGSGEVQLVFGHQTRLCKTIHLLHVGKVKRVRGVTYATGVSGSNCARMIDVARGILNTVCSDVYIYSDVTSATLVPTPTKDEPERKQKVGLGFGLSLVAEGTGTAVTYMGDAASGSEGGETPEDVGRRAAYALLESILRGGVVCAELAPSLLILMSMGSEDVGRIVLGKEVVGSENIIQLARDMTSFGAAGWGIRENDLEEKRDGELVISVVGSGIGNVGRKIG